MPNNPIRFAYFGNSRLSLIVLEALHEKGLLPAVIITTPDQPQGRKKVLTPTPTKEFAQTHNIPVIEAKSIKGEAFQKQLTSFGPFDISLVASYGKIIPQHILDIPKHKTLNIHPSLLPAFRGPAPIQAQILHNTNPVGVSIMELDAEMDHGPILAQKSWNHADLAWPMNYDDLELFLAREGSMLLADILPDWISGKLVAKEQNHTEATYVEKIEKAHGEISLTDDGFKNFLKFQAYRTWPGVYFFIEKNGKKERVIVKDAVYENNTFVITKVLPEGGKEMSFADWERGFKV